MNEIDLANLGLNQAIGLLFLVAAFDVVGAIVAAISQGTFSLGATAVWIESHVLKRVFPIFALVVLGHGIPQLDIPSLPFAGDAATLALVAYVTETVASIRGSFTDATRPLDTTPSA